MTVREYILQKFNAFGTITEAELLDMSLESGINLDDELSPDMAEAVGKAQVAFIEQRVFAPTLKSISESGFSASWDYSNIGKYYMMLCRKYGITPDNAVLGQLGVNAILDRTEIW